MEPANFELLLREAMIARQRAYAPYSRFPVGAAILTAAGRIHLGCNIENAAYPLCLCAERAALASAISSGERELLAMAVVADTPQPVSPCGACRQVLFELAPQLPLLLANTTGQTRMTTPALLLPDGFRLEP